MLPVRAVPPRLGVMRHLSCLALLALTACMDKGEYPSLRPRPFERLGGAGIPIPPPPAAPLARAEIVTAVGSFVAKAEAGQRAFAGKLASTQSVVAQAGAVDSDSWISAQEALSALDVSREPTVTAMANIDALNRGGTGRAGLTYGDNDFAAIRNAGERVNALLEAQQRELDTLEAGLAKP